MRLRYEDFKAAWEVALEASRLPRVGFAEEALDAASLDRRYEVHVEPLGGQDAKPFFVTASLGWRWTALHTARAATSEEDCVETLLGPGRRARTDRPWLRLDFTLSATTELGKPLPLPPPQAWAAWARETLERLEHIEPLLPAESVLAGRHGRLDIRAWRGEPEVTAICAPDGTLKLSGVSLAAGQLLTLPRQWSDSSKRDASPEKALRQLLQRLKASLRAWSESLDHLTPRPPAAATTRGRRTR